MLAIHNGLATAHTPMALGLSSVPPTDRANVPETPMEPASLVHDRYSHPPLSWAPSHPSLLQVGMDPDTGGGMGALVESGIGSAPELVRENGLIIGLPGYVPKKRAEKVEPRNRYYT